jgi:hypothetical protein
VTEGIGRDAPQKALQLGPVQPNNTSHTRPASEDQEEGLPEPPLCLLPSFKPICLAQVKRFLCLIARRSVAVGSQMVASRGDEGLIVVLSAMRYLCPHSCRFPIADSLRTRNADLCVTKTKGVGGLPKWDG